jgi:hypothetical protein
VNTLLQTVAVGLALVVPRTAAAADEKPITPVKLQIVLSRYQGEKKVSSLPYTLVINANGPKASLRMGSSVPIPSTAFGPRDPGGAGAVPMVSYQYRDVGISIDCTAASMDDGRFRFELSIDDSSVYGDDSPATKLVQGAPSFRSFRVNEQVVLKDGQSREFVAATDKVNGEVTKVEVTLTVVK